MYINPYSYKYPVLDSNTVAEALLFKTHAVRKRVKLGVTNEG